MDEPEDSPPHLLGKRLYPETGPQSVRSGRVSHRLMRARASSYLIDRVWPDQLMLAVFRRRGLQLLVGHWHALRAIEPSLVNSAMGSHTL
jgi:hypothetical protein